MILYMFSIKDSASQAFGAPISFAAPGLAVRTFTDEVNRAEKDNPLYAHPDDFDLCELGHFDTESGDWTQTGPVVRTRGKDVSLKYVEGN